jgi:glycosyltransferase involved in cell wall biosynthesis
MKIAIEGQRLFRTRKHGMDMVALELIRNLQKIDKTNEYYIFVKPDEDSACLTPSDNFHIIELGGGPYPLWEQRALPKAVKQYGCELLHCTSNTAPLSCSVPLVVTLHDIIYMEKSYLGILKGSGTPYQKFGNIYRRYIVPRMIPKTKKMITVSKFEKKRIDDFFQLNQELLEAVYNGVSEHFKPIKDEKHLADIASKYKLPEKFFFFLGNTDPKKNTKGVLTALRDFLKVNQEGYKLVMPDYNEEELKKLLNQIGAPELRKEIHLTGYIVNTDLPGIINLAKIFLYPSLRESFGIPLLEGMRCGVPVITSNTSSMPEVSGNAALIIDPYKPEQITEAILKLIDDKELYNKLIDQGIEQAKNFSWENMAKQVLSIYEEVLNVKKGVKS